MKENYEIKIEKSEELKLLLKPIICTRIKPIEFSLTKNIISNEDMISILIDKIHSLEKENFELKNKLNEFEDLFYDEIQEKKRKQEEITKLKEKYKDCIIGDKITTLERCEDYELLKKGISEQITELINKKIKLELIFKSSRDGYTAEDFHRLCDDKSQTVTIIKTGDNTRFGGFLNIKWGKEGGDQIDKKSFLFSFNFNKIYQSYGSFVSLFNKKIGPYFEYAFNIYNDFKE